LNEAQEIFTAVLDSTDLYMSPNSVYAHLGYLLYRKGEHRLGLTYVEVALAHVRTPYYLWLAGLLAAGAGDIATAVAYADDMERQIGPWEEDDAAVEALSNRRFYYHLRGHIALAEQKYREATEMFRATLRYSSRLDNAFFRTDLGRAYLEAGESVNAVRELTRALEFNKYFPEALLYLGRAQALEGNDVEAEEDLARLKNLWKNADAEDPLNVELNQLLSQISERK
jgi:tetratricopeptide (TPR) repeat protein